MRNQVQAEEINVYREGMTGSHLAVGGMERMIIPRQVSSVSHRASAEVVDCHPMGLQELYMVLYIRALSIDCFVK